MKRAIVLLLLLMLASCGQASNSLKHFKSLVVGLDRHIVLYTADGKVIREWNTTAQIEDRGGTCYFICAGKAVIISGTFVIEER